MTYRCQGCRQYFRGQPHRRIGLSRVCSPDCVALVAHARRDTAKPAPSTPPDVHQAVLDRDQRRCRYCGTTQGLHVHHIVYRSQGGRHVEENLITLCHRHHDTVHANKGYWQPICEAYINDLAAGRQRYLIELDRILNGPPPAGPADQPLMSGP